MAHLRLIRGRGPSWSCTLLDFLPHYTKAFLSWKSVPAYDTNGRRNWSLLIYLITALFTVSKIIGRKKKGCTQDSASSLGQVLWKLCACLHGMVRSHKKDAWALCGTHWKRFLASKVLRAWILDKSCLVYSWEFCCHFFWKEGKVNAPIQESGNWSQITHIIKQKDPNKTVHCLGLWSTRWILGPQTWQGGHIIHIGILLRTQGLSHLEVWPLCGDLCRSNYDVVPAKEEIQK